MLPLAILAGGFATRLGNLARNIPKCLIEINGRPFVDWQLDLLKAKGYSDFVFCISYKSELVQNYLGDGSSRGIQIRYSLDGNVQLGTGGAIRAALPLLGNEFGVLYGDSFLPTDYSKIESKFQNSSRPALMTVYKNENKYDASNVEFREGSVMKYKKGINDPKMQHIDYGLSFFRRSAFPLLEREGAFDLSDTYHLLSSSQMLEGFEVFERFYEIGSIKGIKEFSEFLGRANK